MMGFVDNQQRPMAGASLPLPLNIRRETLVGDHKTAIIRLITVLRAPAAIEVQIHLRCGFTPLFANFIVVGTDDYVIDEVVLQEPPRRLESGARFACARA